MAAPTPSAGQSQYINGSTIVNIAGQDVIIIFLFKRISTPGDDFGALMNDTDTFNAHVAAISAWIPQFNNNVPDIDGLKPSQSETGRARPLNTLVVVAPYHIGYNATEAAHITVKPARDFQGKGTYGGCHIYMDAADGVYTNYKIIHKGKYSTDKWASPAMRQAIRDSLHNRRTYPASALGAAPAPAPPPPPSAGASSWAAVAAGKKRAGVDRYDLRHLSSTLRARRRGNGVRVEKSKKRPRPYPRPPPRAVVDGGVDVEEWDVEGIVAARQSRRGRLEYRVRWAGWPLERNVWHPAADLRGAARLLAEYHSSEDMVAEVGPPARLAQWLRAASRGRTAAPHGDDNKASLEWWGLYSAVPANVKWE